jgi:hypothetical protein
VDDHDLEIISFPSITAGPAHFKPAAALAAGIVARACSAPIRALLEGLRSIFLSLSDENSRYASSRLGQAENARKTALESPQARLSCKHFPARRRWLFFVRV